MTGKKQSKGHELEETIINGVKVFFPFFSFQGSVLSSYLCELPASTTVA